MLRAGPYYSGAPGSRGRGRGMMVSRGIGIILATLKAAEGNKSNAARGLTITRKTLHNKLHTARSIVADHLAGR
jgi:hypothetical protein